MIICNNKVNTHIFRILFSFIQIIVKDNMSVIYIR